MKKLTTLLFLLLIAVFACHAQNKKINVLVFSKTTGFRHNSISSGLKMMSDLAQDRKWILTATENADLFTPEFLKTFDAVVFLNPTMEVLNDQQQKNFEEFMATGKGFVGIHAAADCEYEWPWYGKLNGAFFKTHPPAQTATVIFEDTDHPSMVPFKGMDETSLDEATLKDDKWKMTDHPLIWSQEIGNSRSFYTVFGHTPEAFQDPKVKEHIGCAVDWVAKRN